MLLGHVVKCAQDRLRKLGDRGAEMHAFLEDIGLTIHPHPTLGEGMMEAAMNGLGHAIHILNREQSSQLDIALLAAAKSSLARSRSAPYTIT